MKHLKFHILFLLFISLASPAQNWKWLSSAGGDGSDKGTDMDIDNYGNVYVSGYYNTSSSGVVMFSSITPTMNWGKEAFVARTDSLGNWIWVTSGIGGWDERALGMHVDKLNNCIYVTGCCWDSIHVGSCTGHPTTFNKVRDNIFLSKLDMNGNCQWLVRAGSDEDDHGHDMVTDRLGNVYLTGFIGMDTARFGDVFVPNPTGDTLGFVAKVSSSGVFKWVTTFFGVDGERDNRIAIDGNANTYVTGSFYNSRTFGTSTITSNGGQDIYVLKIDSAGNEIWARSAGSTLNDRGNSVTVDSNNDVYVTGEFRDVVAFGTDTVNNYGGPGGRDIFVAKITDNGNWKWASKAGSSYGSERGNRIVSNNKDLLYVTGEVKNTAKFGAITLTVNPLDSIQVFISCIDTGGIWRWVTQGGSHYEDRGAGIAVDDLCNVYVSGFYEDTVRFGPFSDTAVKKKDIYVCKLTSNCNAVGIGIHEYEPFSKAVLFPNPSNDKFSILLDRYYEDISLLVFDPLGRELQKSKLRSVNRIDIHSINSAGIYFIKLMDNNGSVRIFKAVKE
jgi:hypothetical protein